MNNEAIGELEHCTEGGTFKDGAANAHYRGPPFTQCDWNLPTVERHFYHAAATGHGSPPMLLILPSTSDSFLLKNLVSGTDYNLCVLAIFDDTVTSLAATKVLGCIQFGTKELYPECRSLQAHFLGGTLTILIGGIVVVTLLVFTVALMVRHRVCSNHEGHCHHGDDGDESSACCQGGSFGSPGKGAVAGDGGGVYDQSNGNRDVMMVVLPNGLTSKQQGDGAKEKEEVTERQKEKRGTNSPPVLPPKPREELNGGGKGGSNGGENGGQQKDMTVALCDKRLSPYTERATLYYTPVLGTPPSNLNRQSRGLTGTKGRARLCPDVVVGGAKRASFTLDAPIGQDLLSDWRIRHASMAGGLVDKWNSSQAYQSPGAPLSPSHRPGRAKRSNSLDMGSSSSSVSVSTTTVATQRRYGGRHAYAKRLSVTWTRRSKSLHGMLVHCASTTSTTSSTTSEEGSIDEDHGMGNRGYVHSYNTNNSNSHALARDVIADYGNSDRGIETATKEMKESVV
ncbi:hypothetical protein DPEC_G00105460 [Dallia pectoralis]|uniref:Uncharacterized protein n=1 Tax=Dallia pectoralis TaxID=75939 RepID=A0ACC2GXP3_DALPE|nr:hypothetical protein DPEC_G00105460 [Dallia pectoralis]